MVMKESCNMEKRVEYKHPNGYSAILYGQSSMSIYYQGKQVSHTGFRNVNTEKEVLELLEEYPEFFESNSYQSPKL